MAKYVPLQDASLTEQQQTARQDITEPYRVLFPRAKVVRIRRSKGQLVQGCDVYIAGEVKRGGWDLDESIWKNPYTPYNTKTLQEALEKYEKHVRWNLWHRLIELRGQTLGCWCKPQPCHGDVLIKLLDEYLQSNADK